MRCLGRTKSLVRCNNKARFLFCKKHYWQSYTFLISLAGFIAALTAFVYYGTGKHLWSEIIHLYPDTYDSNKQVEPFDTTKGSFNVLLLPFEPLEKCKYKETHIETALVRRLDSLNVSDNLNLQVKFDTLHCIHTCEEAEALGKKLRANLVIWGDLYEHCSPDTTEACLKYINLSAKSIPGVDNKGGTDVTKLASLAEMKQGKLQKNIDYILYWTAAARAYKKSNFALALSHFKIVEKTGSQSDELFFYIANCSYYLRQIKAAEKYYVAALRINPSYVWAHDNYAILLEIQSNDIAGAKKHYENALEIDQNDAGVHLHYANLLAYKLNDAAGAKTHYEWSLKLDSNNTDAHGNYAILLADKLNDSQGAKKHYERLLAIDPKDAVAHYYYAIFLEDKLNEVENAKKHYERALEINPRYADAYCNCAKLLKEKLNRPKEALAYYKKAIQLDPAIKTSERDKLFGL